MPSQPKILLFGVGSIGAVYLHQLQRASCHVTAVCRSNYNTIATTGITLHSHRFGNVTYHPDLTFSSIESCPSDVIYDYIVVCTKSFPDRQPTLSTMLRPVVERSVHTSIVLAQNGIDIETEVAIAFPQNPLISGVVYLPATQTQPGVIEYSEMLNLLELGTYPADADLEWKVRAEEFAALMIRGGGGATVHDDIQTARWAKLVMNAAWNPVCALTMCTDGGFLGTSDFAEELVLGVMMEVVGLARRVGVKGVDEGTAKEKIGLARSRAINKTGREMSMLQDVRAGRSFEVEAIIGNAVRLGRRHGVEMLRLETVYALAKARCVAIENGGELVR